MARPTWTLAGFFAVGCLAAFGYSYVTRGDSAFGSWLAGSESEAADNPLAVGGAAAGAALASRGSAANSAQAGSGMDASANGAQAGALPAQPDSSPASQPAPEGSDLSPPDQIRRLAAAAMGNDAGARADAITQLGDQPREAALPVLKRVLTGGEPQVDRPLALGSLRMLAIQQGDADGRIRDVLRQAISHADSDILVTGAQSVLDEVEQLHAPPAP